MNIPLKQYWQVLSQYLKPQRKRVAWLAVILLTTIGLRVVNPQIIRQFLDSAQSGASNDQLMIAAGIFLGFALLVQVLSVVVVYLGELVGWTATNNLRADLALHALKLDMTFHNNKTPGEMIERIDGDVMDLAIFFSQLVIRVLGNLLLLVTVLGAFFLEDWRDRRVHRLHRLPVGALQAGRHRYRPAGDVDGQRHAQRPGECRADL